MPASYRPHTRDDDEHEHSHSQTLATNLSASEATVDHVLETKSGDLFTIHPHETIGRAVEVLRDQRIGALLVVDAEGELVGILSERDIVRRLADTPGRTLPQTVAELMTTKLETCTPEDSLVWVLRRMTDGRFRHMPVLEDEELIGMISIGDVVNFRLIALEYEALKLKQLIVG
ncbi:CBS domain-containing protein [Salipiger sp. H15]|uniref:CBS domain-containing protein n=1 Tax=Alloyangia sp. H15 TaxID=3029062 RepID=A0AAU8AJX3_9RHOB